jgi:hypothetical protein
VDSEFQHFVPYIKEIILKLAFITNHSKSSVMIPILSPYHIFDHHNFKILISHQFCCVRRIFCGCINRAGSSVKLFGTDGRADNIAGRTARLAYQNYAGASQLQIRLLLRKQPYCGRILSRIRVREQSYSDSPAYGWIFEIGSVPTGRTIKSR